MKLDAQGAVICQTVSRAGQGAEAVIAQVALPLSPYRSEQVRVITGDTDNNAYGGGTWASRAAGIGAKPPGRPARRCAPSCWPAPPAS